MAGQMERQVYRRADEYVRNIPFLTFPPLTGVVKGVKIYDTQCQGRFATIDRTSDSPVDEIAAHLKLDATISGLVTTLSQTTEMGTPKSKAPLAMLVLQPIQNANPAQRKQR